MLHPYLWVFRLLRPPHETGSGRVGCSNLESWSSGSGLRWGWRSIVLRWGRVLVPVRVELWLRVMAPAG